MKIRGKKETFAGITRTWTETGAKHSDNETKRLKISSAIDALEWQEVKPGISLPAMAGMGIKEAIAGYYIPNVSSIAISSHLAPLGLYGITGHYKNGRARIYVIDDGLTVTAVCSDLFEDIRAAQ